MKPNEELNEWPDANIMHMAQISTTYPKNRGFSVWSKYHAFLLVVSRCAHFHGVVLNARVAPAGITRSFKFRAKIVCGKFFYLENV